MRHSVILMMTPAFVHKALCILKFVEHTYASNELHCSIMSPKYAEPEK